MRKKLFPRLTLALLFSVAPAKRDALRKAQESPPPATPRVNSQTTIPVLVNLVQLRVTVKDQNGILVPDLGPDEFRVFDDRVEQHISYFTSDAFPLSLLVLIDDDLKSNDAQQLVSSLHALAAAIGAEDEAQICRFDLKFYPADGFTRDSGHLMSQLIESREI
jgi:VWFA-related protein